MKICHLGPTTLPVLHDRGGAVQRRMIELAAKQAEAGHDVHIVSADRVDSVEHHRGVQVTSQHVRLARPARDYEFLLRVRKLVRSMRPDVLHFHAVPDGARMLDSLGIPSVLSFDYFRFRGSSIAPGRRHYRHGLQMFTRLLPVSDACRDMAANFWDLDADDMRVLYNGVNLEQFTPDAAAGDAVRRRYGLSDVPTALYVGRLCRQKGTDLLLDAWPRVSHALPAQLVLVGPVEQFGTTTPNAFVERIDAIGARYLGAVDERELAGVYNSCDVFVMPTRHDEMFGMAALEAQACGKPVVASKWGGLVESVGPASGTFFPPDQADQLADALSSLLGDRQRQETMAKAAVAHAQRFDWSEIARESIEIYAEARR
jgi:glycosyltransferase involved in cell wall biosynthesis